MLYGFVTDNVPSFLNYARQFGKISEVSVAAATTVQSRAFARRGITLQSSDAALLETLHVMTANERERFDGEILQGPLVF
jgi:glucose-1-phosphate thymidylyltransferase